MALWPMGNIEFGHIATHNHNDSVGIFVTRFAATAAELHNNYSVIKWK